MRAWIGMIAVLAVAAPAVCRGERGGYESQQGPRLRALLDPELEELQIPAAGHRETLRRGEELTFRDAKGRTIVLHVLGAEARQNIFSCAPPPRGYDRQYKIVVRIDGGTPQNLCPGDNAALALFGDWSQGRFTVGDALL